MRSFAERFIGAVPYLIIFILGGSLLIFIYQNKLTFIEFIDLVKVLIWPAIVLLALLFFRKVFTYLFFSIEEFNFFGTRGRLKSIQEVISEKAEEQYKQQKEEQRLKDERKGHKRKLLELQNSKLQVAEREKHTLQLAKELNDENEELQKGNFQLQQQFENVVAHLKALQGHSEQSENIEELVDVGLVSASDNSENK
ncbi:MAG: hypothetical protein NUV78_03095 [Candidatus Zambryskibacteria bacterium]|nr:hypothetical protein [Candidatus Zambryskibacteria bacterium]